MGPIAKENNVDLKYHSGTVNKQIVSGDRTRLKEVFLNFLSNAINYNKISGSVMISYEKINENNLRISVRDTGSGISEKDKKLLFVPFSHLKEQYPALQGAGVGLAISKYWIDLMGGSISFESTLGKGSTFWIEIPAK